MQDLLLSLGLIDLSSVEEYYPRVRDAENIKVLRCSRSGIIFLSQSVPPSFSYYETKNTQSERDLKTREDRCCLHGEWVGAPTLDDANRRTKDFGSYIFGKRWLDFGTGYGEILEAVGSQAALVKGVEPNERQRNYLQDKGYAIYKSEEEIENEVFDVITLFHVFEHLSHPIETLNKLRMKLAKDGSLILEVPHARDFLLMTLDCKAFKEFTFWSEHLILHTRASLEAFIRKAGFSKVHIHGYQRYPLSNHLYWLARGEPGGHKIWEHLDREDLEQSYVRLLQSIDQTDSLVAIVRH